MEEERQEEQEQRAMAVQARARCRLGNYLGWLAQDLVSQRLFVQSPLPFFSVVVACSRVCVFAGKARQARVSLSWRSLRFLVLSVHSGSSFHLSSFCLLL